MSLYEDHILPHLINCACGNAAVAQQREKIIPLAEGCVLEIGMGSGLNIPYYDSTRVKFVWGLEPSQGMRNRARQRVDDSPLEIRWLDLPGEQIPLADHSADTVVVTYTLCTIPDWHQALVEMRRVLKPGGKLLFCEHGMAPDQQVAKTQDCLTPVWKKVSGGCHLNRTITRGIQDAGFMIEQLDQGYLPKIPKFAGYNYLGVASPT